jgi:hypothetical protein
VKVLYQAKKQANSFIELKNNAIAQGHLSKNKGLA